MSVQKAEPGRLPTVGNLTNVTRGRGYVVGELSESSRMLDYLEKGALVAKFDSVQSVWRAIRELQWEPDKEKASNRPRKRDEEGFHFFNSLNEALSTYESNPKSIRKFKPEDLQLKDEESIGKDVEYDVVGDFIDIGRYLEGQPECFGVAVNGNPDGLHVNLIVNTCAVYHVKESIINLVQARTLRLVDWMEHQGIRCRVTAIESTSCSHIEVIVKDYDDPVDINQLAVAGHSDFLRRVCFLINEQSKTWGWGYGNAIIFTEKMKSKYRASREDGLTIFVSHVQTNKPDRVNSQFDRLRDKVKTVLDQPGYLREFDKVYAVDL